LVQPTECGANTQRHVLLGLALAYLGRKEEAIREGEGGVALDPVSKDARNASTSSTSSRTGWLLAGRHHSITTS